MNLVFTSLLNQGREKNLDSSGEWKVFSPADRELCLGACSYRYADIETAAREGKVAASDLRLISYSDRRQILLSCIQSIRNAKLELLQLASQELGRSFEDLEQEWKQVERFLKAFAGDALDDYQECEPRGVTAVVGSYVWPIFYTLQYAFFNFLAGNSVILKPSEKATLISIKLFEVLRGAASELCALQLVVGDRELGRRLACHELVSTVIFQGSFEVGMRIRQDTLSQPGKELLLYLGAKNPSIVFKDAPESVYEVLLRDAFQGAGQDCKSVSVIFVEAAFLSEFSDRFHERCKHFKIGGPQSDAFMGPLIDGAMLDRYLKFIGISEREGAEILMRGKPLPSAGKGNFVTPTLARFENLNPEQMKRSVSLQTEILSPHVALVGFQNEEALLPVIDQMTHGNSVSIWTENQERAGALAGLLNFGRVGINRSLLDLDPWLTHQARKKSGNHAYHGRDQLSQLTFRKTQEH